MIGKANNCCTYIFNNKKQNLSLKSNCLKYGPIDLGILPTDEKVESICGILKLGENRENYYIMLQTLEKTYFKTVSCDFNSFLDVIFHPRYSKHKYTDILRGVPWVAGELNEMEIC